MSRTRFLALPVLALPLLLAPFALADDEDGPGHDPELAAALIRVVQEEGLIAELAALSAELGDEPSPAEAAAAFNALVQRYTAVEGAALALLAAEGLETCAVPTAGWASSVEARFQALEARVRALE